MSEILLSERIKGAFWGFITGDALGLPVKNQPREHRKIYPMDTMTGWGTYNLTPGHWSDESSILLNSTQQFIEDQISSDAFLRGLKGWYYSGNWNSSEEIIEINEATRLAIESYASKMKHSMKTINAELENGSDLLGITIPVTFLNFGNYNIKYIPLIYSKLTKSIHKTPITTIGMSLLHISLMGILKGADFNGILSGVKQYFIKHFSEKPYKAHHKKFGFVLNGKCREIDYLTSNQNLINVLECAFWSLKNSSNFSQAVLNAVNLGFQTDTISAVTGTLAGTYYGFKQIPEQWLSYISKRKEINKLINKFLTAMTEEKKTSWLKK